MTINLGGEFNRWSQLNVEADELAKAMIPQAQAATRQYRIPNEQWSVWLDNRKILKIQDHLYFAVHAKQARKYWVDKEKSAMPAVDYVDWECISGAMKTLPRTNQHFISKFTVGMSGVGKWMKQWKRRDTNNCPRCGQHEDNLHVLLGKGQGASEVWDKAIDSLEKWLEDQ
jgi:hypothetical protein